MAVRRSGWAKSSHLPERLAAPVTLAHEEERRRVARELRDEAGELER